MIKWVLNRGNEENSIVASGTNYRWGHRRIYSLTGMAGPVEGGKMRVDLKVNYAAMWLSVDMTGYFDLEESSLRGTTKLSNGTPGEFVFKRDPDFVRLYPAPSTIDSRARWKFATAVVLDRIRQQSWSPSYILKRIKDGKRYMKLAIRDKYYGRDLDDNEKDEYCSLLSSLYESDARFYASLINIELSKVPIQYVGINLCFWLALTPSEHSTIECDICDATLGGARILCMDCHDDSSTVDLCSELECLNSVVSLELRPDLKAPHTPNHNMLKVHQILFDRDTAMRERNAQDALEAARETLSDLKAKRKPMPNCVHCRTVVSLPCWYCVDCACEFLQDHSTSLFAHANIVYRGEIYLHRLRIQLSRFQ